MRHFAHTTSVDIFGIGNYQNKESHTSDIFQQEIAITKGRPTPEEIAAVTTLLIALTNKQPTAKPQPISHWTAHTLPHQGLPIGKDAWQYYYQI